MQHLAYKSYGDVAQRTAGEKQIEFALFQQITHALEEVANTNPPPLEAWADAISRNQQLWTTLAVDLLHPNNELPDELKRSLVTLAEFVRRTSNEVLAGTGDLSDLIDINKNIMGGLAAPVEEAPAEDAA